MEKKRNMIGKENEERKRNRKERNGKNGKREIASESIPSCHLDSSF